MLDDFKILKENPDLARSLKLEVTAADLIEFAEALHKQALEDGKKAKEAEEYLTPQKVADMFGVSLVTIWDWDRKGILSPHRLGKRKYYKKSEIEKVLNE